MGGAGTPPTFLFDAAAPTLPATFGLNRGAGAFGGANVYILFIRIWNNTKLSSFRTKAESAKTA